MDYLRNNLTRSFRQPDRANIELEDMESGSAPARQVHPLNPSSATQAHPLNPDSGSSAYAPLLDTGSGSAPYPHPLHTNNEPVNNIDPHDHSDNMSVDNSHPLHPGAGPLVNPAYTFSFHSSSAAEHASSSNPASSSAVLPLSGALPLMSPVDIRINSRRKRSQNDQVVNKVRVVEQTSQIPGVVSCYFLLKFETLIVWIARAKATNRKAI